MRRELNVLALIKGEERYVFVYDDADRPGLIDALRQWAAEPELSFSWFDAAVLTEKARQQTGEKTLAQAVEVPAWETGRGSDRSRIAGA